jgi:hypothetical protein
MRIALGLLPAAHSRGRPSSLLVQQILFRLVAPSRCHTLRYSNGCVESLFVLQTANWKGCVSVCCSRYLDLYYTYEPSSCKGKDGFFCAVLWPWPEFDVVQRGFYLLVNGVAQQHLAIGDLTSNILRHLEEDVRQERRRMVRDHTLLTPGLAHQTTAGNTSEGPGMMC